MSEKVSLFGWLILKTLLLPSYMKVKTFFLKPSTKDLLYRGIPKRGLFLVWYELMFKGIQSNKESHWISSKAGRKCPSSVRLNGPLLGLRQFLKFGNALKMI